MGLRQLYTFLLLACVAGYVWIFLAFKYNLGVVCFFRNLTSLPCPACGVTRSILALWNGNLGASLQNPLAYLIMASLLLVPVGLFSDWCMKDKKVFGIYNLVETKLKKRQYMIPVIVLVGMNWLWVIFQKF